MSCALDFHINLYLLDEQLGIRTLHYAAATTPWVPLCIQRIIGSDALVVVDQHLFGMTAKVCIEQITRLFQDERFVELAQSGKLAHGDMMVKLPTLGLDVPETCLAPVPGRRTKTIG